MNDKRQEKEPVEPNRAFPRPLHAWWDYRRKRFWAVVAVLVYTLAGFVLAPWIARDQIVEGLQRQLNLPVRLAALHVNPWILSVEAEDFAIAGRDGAPLVGFRRLFVNLQLSSLFHRALVLREVTLDQPYGNLVRQADGSLNAEPLLNLGGRGDGTDPDGEAADGSETPFRLLIDDLTVNAGRMDVRDATHATPFEAAVGPIDIGVHEFSTLPDRVGRHRVSVKTAQGTRLEWSGSLSLNPLASEGHVTVEGPYLALAHRYAQDFLNFDLVRGGLEGRLDYSVSEDPGGGLQVGVTDLQWLWSDVELETVDARGQRVRFLQLPAIALQGGSLSWPEKMVSVESFTVTDPVVSIWRDKDGALSLGGLFVEDAELAAAPEVPLESATADEGAPAPAAPDQMAGDETAPDLSPPQVGAPDGGATDWTLALNTFRVEGLAADVTDYSLGEDAMVRIRDLTLGIDDVSNQPGAEFPLALALVLESGGALDLSGSLTVLPEPVLEAEVAVSGLGLGVGQPWLAQVANLQLNDGAVNARVHLASNPANSLQLQGSLEILELSLTDTNRQEQLVGWERLGVDQMSLSLADNRLELSEIDLQKPYGRLRIAEDRTTNYTGLLVETPGTQQPPERPPEETAEVSEDAAPMSITIGRVRVSGGSADYSDLALPLPFRATISELAGQISTLSTTSAQPARVDLRGRVGEYGLTEINGEIQPMNPSATTDLRVLFRNVSMPELTPYTMRFAGRKIDGGTLNLDLHYVVENGRLEGDNGVVIDELVLGEKVEHPDALDLPLGLAVALLTGPDGTIDIDMRVSGDVDDPEFGIGRVVLKAFANLITKIVTAPFSFLGRLVGVDSEDFDRIEFRPGSDALTPPEQEKLVKLSEALTLRPSLMLTLRGVTAAEADRAALQKMRVDAAVESRLEELPEDQDVMLMARRRSVLETLAGERLGLDLPLLRAEYQQAVDPAEPDGPTALDEPAYLAELERRLVEAENVTEEDLAQLAEARAAAVRETLMARGEVGADRVAIADSASVKPEDGWIPMHLEVEQSGREGGGP